MKTVFDVLFAYGCQKDDLTHWLVNEDIAEEYRDAKAYAREQRAALSARLGAEDLALYRKFLNNADEAHQLECEMLFCQGLAVGLRLGAMGWWA